MEPSGTTQRGFIFEIRQEVLAATLDQVVRTLRPERALIALSEGSGRPLRLVEQRGFEEDITLSEADISMSIIESVVGSGDSRQTLIEGATTPPQATESMKYAGIRSVLCSPIVRDGHGAFGVIYMDDKTKIGAFGEQHLSWLARIARALGSNARVSQADPSHSELWTEYRKKAFQARKFDLSLAESFLKKALACTLEGELGALSRARTLSDLSEILRLQGRLDQALKLIKEAIAAAESDLEIDYSATIPFFNNLAGLQYALGDEEQAERLYRNIVRRADRRGEQCKALIPVLCNWATISLKSNRSDTALSLFERAAQLAEEQFGEQNQIVEQCRRRVDECRQLIA